MIVLSFSCLSAFDIAIYQSWQRNPWFWFLKIIQLVCLPPIWRMLAGTPASLSRILQPSPPIPLGIPGYFSFRGTKLFQMRQNRRWS